MGDDANEICSGLTTNNYICMNKTNSNYTIDITPTSLINTLKASDHININDVNTEISLTESTSNHYFIADEKAHCSEKWQDWFCIHNYHNNNRVDKYPETDTMSVGVCYNSCPINYTQSKINKCSIYNVEEDLLYNPLAIIAIFGTNLHLNLNDKVKIPKYSNISDTIGMRGSYLNDLYRVNNNNEFISREYINNIVDYFDNNIDNEIVNITTQKRIILRIIKKLVRKGKNGGGEGMSTPIQLIKADINKAAKNVIKIYITDLKYNKLKQIKLLDKIKDYAFDIDKLDKLFGFDKCGKSKLKNAISYAYNIMRLVFNSDVSKMDENIRGLFVFNDLDIDADTQKNLIKIFKAACYNCFNVNFELFKDYLDEKFTEDGSNPILLENKSGDQTIYPTGYSTCNIDIDKIDAETPTNTNFNIPYYNNITFYDHQLLSEYSENTKSIIQIILFFAIFLGIIVIIWLIYTFLLYVRRPTDPKGILLSYITCFINYCYLFYGLVTYYLVAFISYYYYYFLCKYSRSNYIIINLFLKFLNIFIIFSVVSYVLVIILELLNINYFRLLSRMNFNSNGKPTIPDDDYDSHMAIYKYLFHAYLIGIYFYSMYITRYSLTDKEFDLLTNVDSQEVHASNNINNLLLQNYVNNILSLFNAIYTTDELEDAITALDKGGADSSTVAHTGSEATGGIGAGLGTGLGAGLGTGLGTASPFGDVSKLGAASSFGDLGAGTGLLSSGMSGTSGMRGTSGMNGTSGTRGMRGMSDTSSPADLKALAGLMKG